MEGVPPEKHSEDVKVRQAQAWLVAVAAQMALAEVSAAL
jgi:hypothetical protein